MERHRGTVLRPGLPAIQASILGLEPVGRSSHDSTGMDTYPNLSVDGFDPVHAKLHEYYPLGKWQETATGTAEFQVRLFPHMTQSAPSTILRMQGISDFLGSSAADAGVDWTAKIMRAIAVMRNPFNIRLAIAIRLLIFSLILCTGKFQVGNGRSSVYG